MGQQYDQLSLEERCEIARLQANGCSVRQIAAALDRPASTVSRELKRKRDSHVGLQTQFAQQQARARRWAGSRLDREPDLRRAVFVRLARGWSPEQVAGRLAMERGRQVISYESIYRFIYAQIARTKDYRWRHYLPRGKRKRGCRGRRGGSSTSFIEGRIPVAERPLAAATRKTRGHWEGDLMMFAKYGTPAEAFSKVLHFECESTSPRWRGRQERYANPPAARFTSKVHKRPVMAQAHKARTFSQIFLMHWTRNRFTRKVIGLWLAICAE